jgi:hypothetical protein
VSVRLDKWFDTFPGHWRLQRGTSGRPKATATELEKHSLLLLRRDYRCARPSEDGISKRSKSLPSSGLNRITHKNLDHRKRRFSFLTVDNYGRIRRKTCNRGSYVQILRQPCLEICKVHNSRSLHETSKFSISSDLVVSATKFSGRSARCLTKTGVGQRPPAKSDLRRSGSSQRTAMLNRGPMPTHITKKGSKTSLVSSSKFDCLPRQATKPSGRTSEVPSSLRPRARVCHPLKANVWRTAPQLLARRYWLSQEAD